jgi:hypothetical protein
MRPSPPVRSPSSRSPSRPGGTPRPTSTRLSARWGCGSRARTNELDAGKRWPMNGGEEETAGLWLLGRGLLGVAVPG